MILRGDLGRPPTWVSILCLAIGVGLILVGGVYFGIILIVLTLLLICGWLPRILGGGK